MLSFFNVSSNPFRAKASFQFRNHFLQTVWLLGWVIRPSQRRHLYTGQHKYRINAYTHQTSTPWVGFEPMIPASERAKTVHALDRAATVTGEAKSDIAFYLRNSENTTEPKTNIATFITKCRINVGEAVNIPWIQEGGCVATVRSSGRFLWAADWTFCFNKRRGSFWLSALLLVSQEGLTPPRGWI
jgi:hypothetical protein